MTGYAMQISSAAIALIKNNRSFLEKYRDEKGIWVIGYGHVIRQWEKFNSPSRRLRRRICFLMIFNYRGAAAGNEQTPINPTAA